MKDTHEDLSWYKYVLALTQILLSISAALGTWLFLRLALSYQGSKLNPILTYSRYFTDGIFVSILAFHLIPWTNSTASRQLKQTSSLPVFELLLATGYITTFLLEEIFGVTWKWIVICMKKRKKQIVLPTREHSIQVSSHCSSPHFLDVPRYIRGPLPSHIRHESVGSQESLFIDRADEDSTPSDLSTASIQVRLKNESKWNGITWLLLRGSVFFLGVFTGLQGNLIDLAYTFTALAFFHMTDTGMTMALDKDLAVDSRVQVIKVVINILVVPIGIVTGMLLLRDHRTGPVNDHVLYVLGASLGNLMYVVVNNILGCPPVSNLDRPGWRKYFAFTTGFLLNSILLFLKLLIWNV